MTRRVKRCTCDLPEYPHYRQGFSRVCGKCGGFPKIAGWYFTRGARVVLRNDHSPSCTCMGCVMGRINRRAA